MSDIVIIGAGLTGLSTAYHLEKKGYTSFTIFEKEATPGGLCRSIKSDGFTFDFTGHLLHASDPYFRTLLETIVGYENLVPITRRSFVYSHDTYTRYPYQMNLHGLPPAVIAACIAGYAQRKKRINPRSFADWVMSEFGAGFAEHFFFPYQEKIFAYPVTKLTASWTQRFVPQTSLEEIITGAIADRGDTPVGYNAHMWYPRAGGIQDWVDRFRAHIETPIITNQTVREIYPAEKRVVFADGSTQTYSQLVSTMPLDVLIRSLRGNLADNLRPALRHLVCNRVINFNLGIARPQLSDKHWIYFPETKYPFYRIGFHHNFSPHMAPPGHSALYGEISVLHKDPVREQELTHAAIAATKKLFNITHDEIVSEKIMTIEHAYVIYNQWRDKHLHTVLERLKEHDIYSVGRYGEWKYASMQEGILDGKRIADRLVIAPAQHDLSAPQHIPTRPPIQHATP